MNNDSKIKSKKNHNNLSFMKEMNDDDDDDDDDDITLLWTHKTATDHCQTLLKEKEIGKVFHDDLLKRMVNAQNILLGYDNNIADLAFKIKLHPKFKTKGFRLVKGQGVVALWGYKKCINDIFKKQNKNKKDNHGERMMKMMTKKMPKKEKSMRDIVWRHKRMRFLKSHAQFVRRVPMAECMLCHQLSKVAVDHFPISFQQIQDEFWVLNGVRGDSKRKRAWDKAWVEYHDKRAEFRLLCKSCNSKGGNYGYEKKI